MDFVGQFLDECTVRGAGISEDNTDLYNVYMEWCRYRRVHCLKHKSFTQNLKSRGFSQGTSKTYGRNWLGIELRLQAMDGLQISNRFLGHRRSRPEPDSKY